MNVHHIHIRTNIRGLDTNYALSWEYNLYPLDIPGVQFSRDYNIIMKFTKWFFFFTTLLLLKFIRVAVAALFCSADVLEE